MAWQPDYATSAEVKAYVRLGDTVDDTQVAMALTAASRVIDSWAGRQFGAVDAAEDRIYSLRYWPALCAWVAEIDDLGDATDLTVSVDGTALTSDDYDLHPVNALAIGRPYTRIAVANCGTSVTLNGLWGWASVPVPVKQATLLQAYRVLKRRDAAFGISGSPEVQGEIRLLARIDADAQVLLSGYRRTVGVG